MILAAFIRFLSTVMSLLPPIAARGFPRCRYAKEAADFSTNYKMPRLEFARNHYGQADVAMFDFTSIYASENAAYVLERKGHKLLMGLVGDSLLEPFWPTGKTITLVSTALSVYSCQKVLKTVD